jgi:hypothetical protein
MEDKTYNGWDVAIKLLGFVATAASILIGLSQFSEEKKSAAELEFKRAFWQKQNELYVSVCGSAGHMAATLNEPDAFKKEEQNFLTLYYGGLVLVEDSTVEKAMVEIKSSLETLELKDPDMVNIFKSKVLALSYACKTSSAVFKKANL